MNRAGKTFQILAAVFLLALSVAAQNAPRVLKVEPPNWWANHSINPVRVLVLGENLKSVAKIESGDKLLRTSNLRTTERGDYLFFD